MGIALVASGLLVRTKGQMRTRTAKPVPAYWSARLDGVVVRVLSALISKRARQPFPDSMAGR